MVERLGDAGRRCTRASRTRQVSLDLRLYLRRRIPLLQQALVALVAALAEQASRAGDSLHALLHTFSSSAPVLVAHFFLAHVAPLRRDFDRLTAARAEADALPLAGAVAGTKLRIDVDALARIWGFPHRRQQHRRLSDRDFARRSSTPPRWPWYSQPSGGRSHHQCGEDIAFSSCRTPSARAA